MDFESTPAGTRSRLANELHGVPVLLRTVEAVRAARLVNSIHVLCPPGQEARCARLLEGTHVTVHPHDGGRAPWAALVQSARKWSLDGWRGGIGGSTCFDEYTDCRVLSGLVRAVGADAVLSVAPGAVLFDAVLADRMIQRRQSIEEDVRLIFAQGPPGASGILLDVGLVHELCEKAVPVGWAFAYQPDNPRKDFIFLPCCEEIPEPARHAVGRVVADTDRAVRRLDAMIRDGVPHDVAAIGRWLLANEAHTTETLPVELELELTTDDPFPDSLLRPRGTRVEQRGPLRLEHLRRVVGELRSADDSLLALGGFGDPLCHPNFIEVLRAIRAPGPKHPLFGLAVRTAGVDLTDEIIAGLIEHGVDILEITLDAWTPDLYGRLQSSTQPSAASLEFVRRRMERVSQMCQEQGSARPIVVPSFTKARENVHELDAFHDGWLRKLGAVSIKGYSHLAGQVENRSVLRMAPAARTACRRLRGRGILLADGRMTLCDQDLHGAATVGSISDSSLTQLWRGEALENIRAAHRAGCFDPTGLCARCDEWHRP